MLAGCSSTLLSARPKLRIDASVQFQPACHHFQLPEKHSPPPQQQQMSARRLDLPCGFSSASKVSVEKPPLPLPLPLPPPSSTSCSFRQNSATTQSSFSSSMVAQSPTWGGAIAETAAGRGPHWRQRSRLKRRPHERSLRNDSGDDRAKRTRTGDIPGSCEFDGDEWLPRSIEEPKVFLVPSAASFPHQKLFLQPESSTGEEDDVHSSSWSTYTSSPDRNKNPFASAIGDELVILLTSCADSIISGNHEATSFFLSRLGKTADPMGAPIRRLAAYFAEALALRSARLHPHIFAIAPPRNITDPCEGDGAAAMRLLDCVTPIPKFLHFTMNESLLEAFQGSDKVHVIDFDIKQGLQWPSLLQSLAARPNPPNHIRITGVGESRLELQGTGARLERLAESLGLPFEFHVVVADRLEDVRLWMLHVKSSELVAVNCTLTMHRTLGDETGKAFADFLALIRSTNPAVVAMAEQEAEHNEPDWGTRLSRSLRYYAAVFDAIDRALPRESKARLKVEEAFAKEIRNMVACEGRERIERHKSFENWKKMMQDGGFASKGIGEREMLQGRMILRMYSGEDYGIEKLEGGGGVALKWMHQPLFTVSAWTLPKPHPSSSSS